MNELPCDVVVGPVKLEKGQDMKFLQELINAALEANIDIKKKIDYEMSDLRVRLTMQNDMLHKIHDKLGIKNRAPVNDKNLAHITYINRSNICT